MAGRLCLLAALLLAWGGASADDPVLKNGTQQRRLTKDQANCLQQGPKYNEMYRREEPLYAEEPHWILLTRREPQLSENDPFWVARGRRTDASISSSSDEEPFWAARGRKELDGLWAKRDTRGRRRLLETLVADQPFWPSRGRRSEQRRGLLDSLSTEEPFWAARGRRGLLESLSQEEPFWAARGKKSMLFENLPTQNDLWGRAKAIETSNPDDDYFWSTLHSRSR